MILSCYVALVYRKLSLKSSFFEKAMFPVSEEQRKERKKLIPEAVRRAHMVMHEAISTPQSVVFKTSFHRAGAQSAKAVYFMQASSVRRRKVFCRWVPSCQGTHRDRQFARNR